jgi:hypothetical protein
MRQVTVRTTVLNIDHTVTTVLGYGAQTQVLNFELREYDRFNPKYKIVMDFMELYSYADIFRPGVVIDPVVTVDILDTGPQVGDFENEPDTPKPTIDIL